MPRPKTDRMLFIEARAGIPIEQVLREAYAEGDGSGHRAAKIISDRYCPDRPLSYGVFSDWVGYLGGRRILDFPQVSTEQPEPVGVPA